MVYSKFGNSGYQVSALGFGAMHLPMMDVNGKRDIDYDKALPMMHKAFDSGVNYIDTAPGYCDRLSEVAVGRALKGGYREKVYVSTKNPIENASGDDWLKRLENSLQRMDLDYIDFYHFWGINLHNFRNWQKEKFGPIQAARRAKDEGLIKHISFSFHDDSKNMPEIIDYGIFESVLMQYNLLDRANESNLDYAHSKGLGTVVMGPVAGGRLCAPSGVIEGMLAEKPRNTAEMAMRFVMANPSVNIALSGMRTMEQVEDNLLTANRSDFLSAEEHAKVKEIMDQNRKLAELYCTGCNYCKPCPQNINIAHVFGLMNTHKVYGLTDHARGQYSELMAGRRDDVDASHCSGCGVCESKCPQKLPIIEQLKETHKTLA